LINLKIRLSFIMTLIQKY